MITVAVQFPEVKPAQYSVRIGTGLLVADLAGVVQDKSQIIIISDDRVKDLYGLGLKEQLLAAGYQVQLFSFPAGETSKTRKTKAKLEDQLEAAGCDRSTLICALGGGVVGDMAGFLAATYLRGLEYIQMPTTLLAMVDSAVGGKTAVDTPWGKNRIGAFWQPKIVLADLHCLRTLPREQITNGLVEAFKMFLTSDASSLKQLDCSLPAIFALEEAALADIVARSIRCKLALVSEDERDTGLRQILNFGHTLGHAIEYLAGYKVLHGYAVGLGILLESKMAELLGLLAAADFLWIAEFIQRLGITVADLKRYSVENLWGACQRDKKNSGCQVYIIGLQGLGQVRMENENYLIPISAELLQLAYQACLQGAYSARK